MKKTDTHNKKVPQEQLYHLGAKVLLVNSENNILLLHATYNNKNIWDFPGGRVQIGEKLEQTLYREVQEEVGITDFKNLSYVGTLITDITASTSSGDSVLIIYALFVAKIGNLSLEISSEFSKYEWVPLKTAIKRTSYMGIEPFEGVLQNIIKEM